MKKSLTITGIALSLLAGAVVTATPASASPLSVRAQGHELSWELTEKPKALVGFRISSPEARDVHVPVRKDDAGSYRIAFPSAEKARVALVVKDCQQHRKNVKGKRNARTCTLRTIDWTRAVVNSQDTTTTPREEMTLTSLGEQRVSVTFHSPRPDALVALQAFILGEWRATIMLPSGSQDVSVSVPTGFAEVRLAEFTAFGDLVSAGVPVALP